MPCYTVKSSQNLSPKQADHLTGCGATNKCLLGKATTIISDLVQNCTSASDCSLSYNFLFIEYNVT